MAVPRKTTMLGMCSMAATTICVLIEGHVPIFFPGAGKAIVSRSAKGKPLVLRQLKSPLEQA